MVPGTDPANVAAQRARREAGGPREHQAAPRLVRPAARRAQPAAVPREAALRRAAGVTSSARVADQPTPGVHRKRRTASGIDSMAVISARCHARAHPSVRSLEIWTTPAFRTATAPTAKSPAGLVTRASFVPTTNPASKPTRAPRCAKSIPAWGSSARTARWAPEPAATNAASPVRRARTSASSIFTGTTPSAAWIAARASLVPRATSATTSSSSPRIPAAALRNAPPRTSSAAPAARPIHSA